MPGFAHQGAKGLLRLQRFGLGLAGRLGARLGQGIRDFGELQTLGLSQWSDQNVVQRRHGAGV